ncbi:DUF309 domain-containing protein [Paenibacillus sp. WST5]|uniref:DUF309 domain-containing protein n=2 Tax=Paenibacillus sedimenti TaxID=2770274 RepID=A0A926KMB5_9BACL|nr:DUF309 domain-containing protein [Paenibacillus sedimenti]
MKRYPEAYTDYLLFFHAERDYFECHEVMEEFWKEHPGDERSKTYVALIQIAVGLYHDRRGNRAGSVKMLQSALKNAEPEHLASLGIDAAKLRQLLTDRLTRIPQSDHIYEDLNLPLADSELELWCMNESEKRGLVWQAPSRLDDDALTHKHTLRDRSDVIQERERQQQIRKEKGGTP